MVHRPIAALEATQNYCAAHASHADDCRIMHVPAAMLSAGLIGASLGAAVNGDKGAAVGFLAGVVLGVLFPELAQPSRLRPLARRLHAIPGAI